MRRTVIVMLLCVSASAFAQTDGPETMFKDPLLDNLLGRWDAPGRVHGHDVQARATAEWVLNHQFVQVRLEDTANPSTYEGWFFIGYDFRSERYVVHWLDNYGGRWSETLGYGDRSGNSIRVVFEYGDGPFRNTLTWLPAEKGWHWLIESKDQAGRWKTFAEYNLRTRPLAASF